MGPYRAYRENRRIEPVRRLAPVTKNEAMEMSDVDRERRLEKEWATEAIELRRAKSGVPRRFSDLVPKR